MSGTLDAYYDRALAYIRDHLVEFYDRYAVDNSITVSQAVQNISKWDLNQWKQAVDELNSDGWLPESKKRAKLLGSYAGLNVGNMMTAIAGIGIISFIDKSIKKSKLRASQIAVDERRFLRVNDISTVREAGNAEKLGKTLSSNIWVDGDRLIDDVRAELFKDMQTGKPWDELKGKLIKSIKPNPNSNIADRMHQTQSKIDRLIRSESAKLTDEIDMASYKKAGVKYVNWVTEPGACLRCIDLKEGGPYPIDTAPVVVDDSHPNCRCHKTIARILESSAAESEMVGGAVGADIVNKRSLSQKSINDVTEKETDVKIAEGKIISKPILLRDGYVINVDKISYSKSSKGNSKIKGKPNSVVALIGKSERIETYRIFDARGRAAIDIDITDHGNSKFHQIVPHVHKWEYNEKGKVISRKNVGKPTKEELKLISGGKYGYRK